MAFSCSSFRLHTCSASDYVVWTSFRSYSSKNVVINAKGSNLWTKNSIFPGLRVGRRNNGNFCIKSEMQPQIGFESSDIAAIGISKDVGDVSVREVAKVPEMDHHLGLDNGNGDIPPNGGGGGGGGGSGSGGPDDGGNGENEGNGGEEEEFGPLLKFEHVIRETEARGASLPADMLDAAKSVGLQEVILSRYLDLQVIFV